MIKLFSLYTGEPVDITSRVKRVSCAGDLDQAARKLEVTLAYPIWDRTQSRTQVAPGTKMRLFWEGSEIFRGVAWDREINSANNELTFTAYDYLIYLTKSKVTHNFVNVSPEEAAQTICRELNVETGAVAMTGIRTSRLIAQRTGYEAIQELFAQATKTTGTEYLLAMNESKLEVLEAGKRVADYSLTSRIETPGGNNLLSSSYKDSLEGMVNRVKIYDDKNTYIEEVNDTAGAEFYGLLQENYVREPDKDSQAVATGMLKGLQSGVSVSALGNWRCRTGFAIKTRIDYVSSLQNALLAIEGDTHTWEPGTGKYTMDLNLRFKGWSY